MVPNVVLASLIGGYLYVSFCESSLHFTYLFHSVISTSLPEVGSDPESKIWGKPDPDPESLFNFGSSRSLCGHILSKNMSKLRLD